MKWGFPTAEINKSASKISSLRQESAEDILFTWASFFSKIFFVSLSNYININMYLGLNGNEFLDMCVRYGADEDQKDFN